MNRVFKTKWSVAHQEYVVTDEKHTTKTKTAKSAVALAVAALMLGAGVASAAYMDPCFVAKNSTQLEQAKKSWETAEYQKDWGLAAMNASTAYALGYHGQNTAVAVMDSGALLQKHPELAGDRFHASHATGVYGSTGNRYQTGVPGVGDAFGNGDYTEGEAFDVDGNWVGHVNDTHGTHVTGTVGANRDGSEFHGVSWGSDIWVGTTGGTDNTNYGPFQDYNFFYAGWKALADNLVAANGAERGGVINNSFGTNLRVNEGGTSLPTNTTAQTEYEYFLFKQVYGDKKSFVDAAWDAVKGTNVVQVFTTGNRNMDMPYYRPLYPYFNPEAEQNWIAVAGLQIDYTYYYDEDGKRQKKYNYGTDGKYKYKWVDGFNQAGNAKWWTVVAPGDAIYSSVVYDDHYEATSDEHPLGAPGYASYGGTSMAAPHVSGAMGVLMSRYMDMNAIQVRDVMFTTANHYNTDGSKFEGWTAADGTPDEIYGWGVPDLDKGMYGPGQFLGKFDYNMSNTALDVWTNDISQVALDARKAEDKAWMEATKDGTDLSAEYELGEGNKIPNIDDATISKEDAEKWRAEYYALRAQSIKDKLANGEYDGTLIKSGSGTLVMTGNNTYRGGTTVEGGTLLGFAESFGVTGDDANATANGKVVVNGGSFGLLETYTDNFTMTGEHKAGVHGDVQKAANDAGHSVDVTVNKDGAFYVVAGHDVTMGTLTLNEGATFAVGTFDNNVLKEAYVGETQTGTLTAEKITGLDNATIKPDLGDSAFFDTKLEIKDNKLTASVSRNEDVNFATYASNANGNAIAGAIEGAGSGALFDALIGASKGDVAKTYNSLGDDFILNTRNAGIVNGMTLSRAIKDQAAGIGEGRKVEMADGTARLWATGVGSWSALDYGQSDMDSDFYAGLFGAEVDVCSATKLGLFFGAGSTDNKAGDNKVESDDIHFGAYGVTNFSDVVNATYGFVYSHQSADATRALQVGSQLGMNAFSGDTDITQIFAEAAYTGLNTDAYSIEPYFGLSWIHAESDGFNEQVGTMAFSTTTEDQDVQVTTLGVRGAIPFTMGATKVALKGDVAWNHFFGDTEAEASMNLAGSGVARLKGGELGDMASVGLGVEAQVGKMTTMGLSYTGAYDGDITSHGISANVRFNF